jgi:alpha-ribazole phosphatase
MTSLPFITEAKTIFFVRHGESVANAGGITMEHAVIPLSPKGVAQAAAIADNLSVMPSRVLVSKYLRTQETARPFCARTGVEQEVHPLLHEFSSLDPALLVGMTGAQRRPIADAYWQAADLSARMGAAAETFQEFTVRIDAFMTELPSLPDQCVIFGHGIWFGMLCWRLDGNGVNEAQDMRAFRQFQRRMAMGNGAICVLSASGGPNARYRWAVADKSIG